MISIRALDFVRPDGHGQRDIFRRLNLEIASNQHSAIVGESGSGKTTFLNLLAGLEPMQQGEVHVGEQKLHLMDPDQRAQYRRNIGIVFQHFHLLPSLTVRQNILLPHRLRYGHDRASRLDELVDALKLNSLLDRSPDRLSGGEQQRVAVCRALIHVPDLILADEPTGNLDETNSLVVIEQLRALAQEQNATLLVVTHSRELASLFPNQLQLQNYGFHWQRQQSAQAANG